MSAAPTHSAEKMPPAFSVYLDLVRFTAAILVFLSHACKPGFAENILPNVVQQGRDSVVVFFVLSGLVVAYASEVKDRSLPNYTTARLARLWSVAIPAILLSLGAYYIGTHFNPALYNKYDGYDEFMHSAVLQSILQSNVFVRSLVGALFLNEVWGISAEPFGNAPYWSLGYEFWYYVLFGLAFYLRSWKRIVAVCIAALIVGPKVLLLFPVWLLGVAIYHVRPKWPTWLSLACIIGPFGVYLVLSKLGSYHLFWRFDAMIPFAESWSSNPGWIYVIGVLAAINFVGFRSLSHSTAITALKRPIRWLSGKTLSLYLFHYPLLLCFAAVWQAGFHPVARSIVMIMGTLAIVQLLSVVTEARKTEWRNGLRALGRIAFR